MKKIMEFDKYLNLVKVTDVDNNGTKNVSNECKVKREELESKFIVNSCIKSDGGLYSTTIKNEDIGGFFSKDINISTEIKDVYVENKVDIEKDYITSFVQGSIYGGFKKPSVKTARLVLEDECGNEYCTLVELHLETNENGSVEPVVNIKRDNINNKNEYCNIIMDELRDNSLKSIEDKYITVEKKSGYLKTITHDRKSGVTKTEIESFDGPSKEESKVIKNITTIVNDRDSSIIKQSSSVTTREFHEDGSITSTIEADNFI